MDVNGSRYHLLLNFSDWSACLQERPANPSPELAALWPASSPQPRPLTSFWLASPPVVTDLAWDWEQAELSLQPLVHLYLPRGSAARQNSPPLDPAQRRGAACDRYGNWFWIDADSARIRVLSAGSGKASDFWPSGETAPASPSRSPFQPVAAPSQPAPLRFAGLAVTEQHFLVVGVLEPPGLLVFDLHAGGPPQQLAWPAEVSFAPFDMAPMPGGGVWILERQGVASRYWALDSNFTVLPKDADLATLTQGQADPFQPLKPEPGTEARQRPARLFPRGIALDAASPLDALDPVAIEALPDGSVLILDAGAASQNSRILRYRFGQRLGEPVSMQILADFLQPDQAAGFILNAFDFAFLPEHATPDGAVLADRLYLASQTGDQAFVCKIDDIAGQLVLRPLAEYLPMRLFGARAIVAVAGQVFYDSGERWLPLVPQIRPRFRPEAAFQTQPFDGKQPGVVWHRLMLDATIPTGCQVSIWSRCADDPAELARQPWQLQPAPYRRGDGSELPYAPPSTPLAAVVPGEEDALQPANVLPAASKTAVELDRASGKGTWELLFQGMRGHYLQLRVLLSGDGIHSPRLRACRLYYPRFSYSERYLPGAYRQDDASASFLERYLANLEGFYTVLEGRLAALPALLDVRSAPNETLDWLAGWFGVALDPAWDESRRRLFIRNAMLFFQYRGTIAGLLMALNLTLVDPVCPDLFNDPAGLVDLPGSIRVVEKYRTRRIPPIVYGDPSEATPADSGATSWQPGDGAQALHALYAQALEKQGLVVQPYPISEPEDPYRTPWRTFSRQVIGFIPAAGPRDLEDWQRFLANRYGTLAAYQKKYANSGSLTSFKQAPLPASLPADKDPLLDWYTFETNLVSVKNHAHQFTVLLPLKTGLDASSPEYTRRLGLAQRILELEKPAHTGYDIRFYWAMFRLGEARLGYDTVIDLGGRDPRLNPALILGQGHLAESHLSPRHPQDLSRLVGRDPGDRIVLSNGYGI